VVRGQLRDRPQVARSRCIHIHRNRIVAHEYSKTNAHTSGTPSRDCLWARTHRQTRSTHDDGGRSQTHTRTHTIHNERTCTGYTMSARTNTHMHTRTPRTHTHTAATLQQARAHRATPYPVGTLAASSATERCSGSGTRGLATRKEATRSSAATRSLGTCTAAAEKTHCTRPTQPCTPRSSTTPDWPDTQYLNNARPQHASLQAHTAALGSVAGRAAYTSP
jgi:hypothetical protein